MEDQEIEEINEDSGVTPEFPFNPNDVKISVRTLTIGGLIEFLLVGKINLDADFQRSVDLWNPSKQSRFIESLLLRLPIPIFYFNGKEDNSWVIIDGLQRISTLKNFIIDKVLALENLEFLKQYEGRKFDELPNSLQRRITGFSITMYLVEKGTPDSVKYNIFSRINQGGLTLTPQEIRHAIHQGKASMLIADLVRGIENNKKTPTKEGESFIRATGGAIKSHRMEDRDFATRFVAFYLIPYQEYQPDMDTFLNKGMKAISKLDEQQIQQLKEDFRKAMNTAWVLFGNDAFRRQIKEGEPRKRINKALFEVLSVSFARLSEDQCDILIQQKELFKQKMMNLNANDAKFSEAITQGTAHREKVEYRFQSIKKIIEETLHYNDCSKEVERTTIF